MSEISEEVYANGMRHFNERIKLAQAEGNSRLANEIYSKQLEWIGRTKGDQPIVDGRRTA